MIYPIGIQTFEQIISDGFVYVDKTDMVYSLATEGKIYFLSRPRRFGKSLLISTFKNYFLGRKELFKGLKIDALEKEWKTYPVFHLDFNGKDFNEGGKVAESLESFVSQGEALYGKSPFDKGIGDRFAYVLKAAHEKTGQCCVVLIDEYDKPMLDVMDTDLTTEVDGNRISLEDHNRNVLKAFYSTFKLADEHLRFVLLTGVTKFSQLTVFSGFNQPKDISMHPKYEAICGITEREVDEYFSEAIREMADVNGFSYDEMRAQLRSRYDGYHFSTRMTAVYNPFSLLNALDRQGLEDFWFRSGTPTYLVRLLEQCKENLNDLTGKYYKQAQFEDYRANGQEPLPMIYQSGYLTVKDFDRDSRTFLLDFPNDEVKEGFVTVIANSVLQGKEDTGLFATKLTTALKHRDLESFRLQFDSFLASIPYTARRKENETEKERYFSYTLYLIFRIASCYVTYIEKEQSYGRLDCAILTTDSVYIFEFKLDGNANEAIDQINDRHYDVEFRASGKKIYKIGLSISSETGHLDDWKVSED